MQCDILPNIIILSSKSKRSYMLKLWRYIQVLINFTAYDYRYIFLSFFLIHRVFNTFLGRKDWCFEKFPWSKFYFFNQKWWKIRFFTLKMGGRLIHEFDLYTSKYGNPVLVAWSNWQYYYSPLDRMLVHGKVTPPPKHYVAGTHLYRVERDNMEQSFLSKETTWWQRPGLNHQPSGWKSDALTTRPPRFHSYLQCSMVVCKSASCIFSFSLDRASNQSL